MVGYMSARIVRLAAALLPLLSSGVALGDAGTLSDAGQPPLPDLTTDAGTDIDWTVSTVRFPEGWGHEQTNLAFVTIKLDRPAPARGFHLAYALEERTAGQYDVRLFDAGVYYFQPGETEKVFGVEVFGDREVECDEAVALRTWLPNLTSKVRYGFVYVVNDDWEGPPSVPVDAPSAEAGTGAPADLPDSGPTDVPLIKDLGPSVRLPCHDDPKYDPLAIPPPRPDAGIDLPADIVYQPLPDTGGGADGGASDTGATGVATTDAASPGQTHDSGKLDAIATQRPDQGGGCSCNLASSDRTPLVPGLVIGGVLLGLALRRGRRQARVGAPAPRSR
jgi:hypothetical protein